MTLTLRTAAPADEPALAGLEREAMGAGAWRGEALAAELAAVPGTRWVVVADLDGTPVGYAVLMTAADTADVHRVAVADAHRRQGLGRLLLDALLGEAARRGCGDVLLEVAATNRPAIALYQAAGFVEISRRPRYYPHGVDALVMRVSQVHLRNRH